MAQAVVEMFEPGEAKYTIGPPIENGFYYDFDREEPFTEDDLAVIEKRMQEIVERDEEILREVWDREGPHAAIMQSLQRFLKKRYPQATHESAAMQNVFLMRYEHYCQGNEGLLVDFTSTENTSVAMYGQGTWTPAALGDRWHFTLGARYSDDSREAKRDNSRVSFGLGGVHVQRRGPLAVVSAGACRGR